MRPADDDTPTDPKQLADFLNSVLNLSTAWVDLPAIRVLHNEDQRGEFFVKVVW